MDGYRGYPSEYDQPAGQAAPAEDVASAEAVAAAIGSDERRMHVRAYNYWVSLLDGRDYPSIEDLEPADLEDFAPNSVLLDFTSGRAHPATSYIGAAIREECGVDESLETTADVPSRSLLSRLTDHYMQIIANRAPVGFEAEFVNQRGSPICYRGILMPFSSDGDTIDFIYGVINWKQASAATIEAAAAEVAEAVDAELPQEGTQPLPASEELSPPDNEDEIADLALDDDAGLADRLCAARETAAAVKAADGRSRAALYRALGQAYDFALAAHSDPAEYAEILEDSGVKAQARAPMTPIVKLVFGVDYDKTRLTEFASALSFAKRQDVGLGAFQALIETQPGGLKALVAAERQARRPGPKPDTIGDAARAKLRDATPLSLADLDCADEFCLVLTRRNADGGHDPVALVTDPALLDRAIRRSA